MGRIRTVKPDLGLHEELYDLEQETGLPIRYAFIMLFTQCDREGRFKWRPRTLKAAIMPHDNVDFSRVLHAWTTRGFVVKYAVNGEEFGHIPTFTKHQVINNREAKSEIPEPTENNRVSDACLTRGARVPDACTTRTQGKGKEGKGKEGKGKPPLSGKPDVTPDKRQSEAIANKIIDHLNQQAGKNYQHTDSNRKYILARLREGYTAADCATVIVRKVRQWKGTSQEQYLRPSTLFNSEKFPAYLNEPDGDLPPPGGNGQDGYDPARTDAMLRELYPDDYRNDQVAPAGHAELPAGGETWQH